MFETELINGSRLLVRAVTPQDREYLLSGFDHLSARSRYFRFLTAMKRLSERDLKRFTATGNDDHRAFGALDMSGTSLVPVGIARYERSGTDRSVAEMAVTVVDAYQGMGVGPLMIGTTAYCAARGGIRYFHAFVHPDNSAMARLLRGLGADTVEQTETEVTFRLPIYGDPARYPDSRAGRTVRRAYRLMADAASEPI